MSIQEDELDIIDKAWEIFHLGDFQDALNLCTPLAKDYELAISICILANMRLGNLADSDKWMIQAGNQGVRDFWIDVQEENFSFAVLIARLDVIQAPKTEFPVSTTEFVTLTQYLFEGFHAELSLYKSVEWIRRLWIESEFNEMALAARFKFIFDVEDVEAEGISQFLSNLGFLLNCSFSSHETEVVMKVLYKEVV